MERIVVGFDGSEHSRKALERAADIANGATVAVVAAANVTPYLRDPAGGVAPIDPADVEAREKALAQAREYLAGRGVRGEFIAGVGRPADVLVQEAQESGAELIVVGTRGHGAARQLFLGSVSTNVVHHATCDVLVVR
ncbi:MAG: universal stress protein [Actinomycetota bacterium]|nr:universal stress protein [Actinomycetota bacterium]